MKQVYKLFASAAVVLVGVTNLSARNWTPSSEATTEIVAGKKYALQGLISADGKNRYLQGTSFTEKPYLTPEGVFEFVPVENLKDASGSQVYYLVVPSKKTDKYVSAPGNNTFYTSSANRAWKVVVKEAVKGEKEYSYAWETKTASGADTTINLKGKDAYVRESMENEEHKGVNQFDLSTLTWSDINNALVIVTYQSKQPNKPEKDAEYNFFLTNDANSLSVSKGTNYDRNAWNIFEVTENGAKDGLNNVLEDTFGEGFDIEDLVNPSKEGAYVLGESIGQYDRTKYEALKALYNKAKQVQEGALELSDEEIDKLAEQLPVAFAEFKQSGKPLGEGYYIIESYRGRKESGYDGGAIYDGAVANPTNNQLLWTYKGGAITYDASAPLDYKSLRYIWKVEKDNANPGYFFFKNMQTNRYIGNTPAMRENQTPLMTEQPEVSYNIVANKNQAGFFSFYSPKLWKGKGTYWGGNYPDDRWQFGGLHTGGDHNRVVVWDWQAAASAFYARIITKAQVESILNIAQQGINNDKAKDLINKAQSALDKGYTYMAIDAATGNRLEKANSGDFSTEEMGLLTDASKLKAPMADKDEGKNIDYLLDGDATTMFHSSWHGGADAWTGGHYLQFQLDDAQTELYLKWVKRINANGSVNNNGAPAKVTLWGAKADDALDKDKANKLDAEGKEAVDKDGNVIVNFDAWKKGNGWDSLGVTSYVYPYEIVVNDAKKPNAAGYAYFKVPEGYKNFRLEVNTRVDNGNQPSGNLYYNGAEFRVYKGKFDELNSLITAVPTADVEALRKAIATLSEEVKGEKATQANIDALQKAYDQFLKNYPEPARVTDALTEAKALSKASVEGTQIGYYKSGAKEALDKVIKDVEEKLAAQVKVKAPTVVQINGFLAELNAALTEFAKQLIMPEAGIYRIQSASADKTRTDRSVTAVNSSRESNLKMRGMVADEANKGEYTKEVGFESVLGAFWDVQKVDTGYTLQNIYTGLYAAPKEGTAVMTQSEKPYVFAVTFAKTPGCFNFVAKASDVADKKIYMNAESDNLVLWNTATGQDNSAFKFVEAKDDLKEALDSQKGFKVYVSRKVAQIVTLPVDAEYDSNTVGEFYTVIGQDADFNIQLAAAGGKLKGGQAYVFIPSATNESNLLTVYAPEAVAQDYTKLAQTHTPGEAVNGLTPVFENTRLQVESGIFNNAHDLILLSEAGEYAWANTGFFDKMPSTTQKGAAFIPAEATVTTIGKVVVVAGKNGKAGVYTLSGVRVNNANNLPAGVYIVNGQKQVVK